MNLVEEYNRGKYYEVWRKLVLLGEEVRNRDILPLAQQIARQAMVTVRRDIEELIKRWKSREFVFGYDWAGKWAEKEAAAMPPVLADPTNKDIELLDDFEKEFGPLPVVLRAFYEIIGAVNFVGKPTSTTYPWPAPDKQSFDPIFVYDFKINKFMYEKLRNCSTTQLNIFPDPLSKFFYSGVGPITTTIPSKTFDAVLAFEGAPLNYNGGLLYFGDYLRIVILSYGGLSYENKSIDEAFKKDICNGLDKF